MVAVIIILINAIRNVQSRWNFQFFSSLDNFWMQIFPTIEIIKKLTGTAEIKIDFFFQNCQHNFLEKFLILCIRAVFQIWIFQNEPIFYQMHFLPSENFLKCFTLFFQIMFRQFIINRIGIFSKYWLKLFMLAEFIFGFINII